MHTKSYKEYYKKIVIKNLQKIKKYKKYKKYIYKKRYIKKYKKNFFKHIKKIFFLSMHIIMENLTTYKLRLIAEKRNIKDNTKMSRKEL